MRKSGDPFEVDPLPKTFYYPSLQKLLPEHQRKICFSPDQRKEDHSKSPADEKFLQQTNHLKIHEIPTRENGTTDSDQSSSSKFDESWPSTERAMVSTPEADTEISGMSKSPSSDGSILPLKPLPDSTLARYIHRFRHAPPSSRQVRDHNYFDSGKGGEFWWLSPSPPSSSTPKEGTPPDRLLGPSPRPSLSPKLRKSGDRRSVSPGSPVSKARSTSSPSKSSLEGLDTKTADLQQRAKTLLEKSESTLESSSSEAHRPARKAKQGPPKDRTPREVPSQQTPPGPFRDHQQRQLQPRPAPPPEEDILYQWRLARKMERAQEQVAKWGLPRSTLPSGSIQPHPLSSASRVLQTTPTPLASTHEVAICQRPEFHVPVPSVASSVSGEATSSSAKTQTTFSTPAAVMSVGELIPPSHRFPSQFGVTSQVPASSSQPQRVAETSSETQRPVSSIEKATTVTTETPVVVLEQVHEPVLVEQEKFQSVNIPSHLHLSCDILPCPHQRALIKKAITDQSVKLPLSSPVAESDLRGVNIEQRETERGYKPRGSVSRQSHDTRHIHGLPRTKQARSEDGKSKVGPHELKERTTSLPEESEGERQKTKDVLRKKPKFKTKRETFHDSSPSDVLSGVIGQVVSERLFSTPRSSTSSLTGSEEGVELRDLEVPNHHHVSEEENANPEVNSDNEFPDDEVLKMLRQQARRYREQLRQIDSLLNQQTPGPC